MSRIRTCQCQGRCGRTWDMDLTPTSQRQRKYHVDCTDNPTAHNKELAKRMLTQLVCACGVCGLTFPPFRGRKFHPDCPIYDDIQKQQGKRRDKMRELRTTGEIRPPGGPRRERKLYTRHCAECYGMPHRRPEHAPCACGEAYSAEQLTADTVARRYVAT